MSLLAKRKRLLLLALLIPGVLGVGRWIQLRTPPRGLPEILIALASPDPEFASFLQAKRDIRETSSPQLYRLRSNGAIWRFSHMRRTGQQAQAIVKSSNGQRACLTLDYSGNEIPIPWVWRYISGSTLAQMADSALEVTQAPGVVLGYWKDGAQEVEARGYSDLESKKRMRPEALFRVNLDNVLVPMAVARLADQRIVPWDTNVSTALDLNDFPTFAKGKSIEFFTFDPERQRNWPTLSFEPSEGAAFEMERRKFVEASINTLHSFKRPVVPHGKWPGSSATALTIMTLEKRTGSSIAELVDRQIFQPLGLPDVSFEGEAVQAYTREEPSGWASGPYAIPDDQKTPSFVAKPTHGLYAQSMLRRDGVGISVRDLLALGRFRLESLKGASSYLSSEALRRSEVRSGSFGANDLWQLGWQRGGAADTQVWSMEFSQPGITAYVIAFPEQNAVVAVAANFPLGSTEYMGGIIARIAERLCGVEY